MSLKYAFLALLAKGSKHGYELKSEFEDLFGGMWEVNAGQIYTTLQRLQRDGFVQNERIEQEDRPDKKVYTVTQTGMDEVISWLKDTVAEEILTKDDLALKLIILKHFNLAAAVELMHTQRTRYLELVRSLVTMKQSTTDNVKNVIVDRHIRRLEADLEWLQYCEDVWFES